MSDFFWPDDQLSSKEQWAIYKKHKSRLSDVDQVKVVSASQTFVGLWASGAAIGLGLGWFLTRTLGRSHLKIANVFNNPLCQQTAIGFPNGGTQPLADFSAILQSSKIEIAATNVSVVCGAMTVGVCFGMLFGIGVADRKLRKDKESGERIVLAWKRCRAELYRKEAEHIEATLSDSGSVDPWQ